jgi:pilus assembly protein FimV
MNTSQKDQNQPVMDEVDDLTRFLDEDFGTEEVDLFEFTSGEEHSPLTHLKTIILGLDWEITDEALQDLADEIENLRHLEQFQHDKVTQVYLQALDKIGSYVFSEGAHAHPNAIKLLMTLFYDFEKITSSDHITGSEITALLKADVRKFKILQYQIAQKHGATIPEAAAAAAELPITDNKTLLEIHAAILELDWEVTDQSLNNLAKHLSILQDQFADNRYIQILVRGLSTLNKYIDEERARTHPESFTLLHYFFEALEALVEDKNLDEENSQKLLINCVNRLNALKNLISKTPQELDKEAIVPVPEEDEKEPFAEKAEEPVVAAPVFAPPAPEKDEYEDELDVELPVDEAGEVAPALFESEEVSGFGDIGEEAELPSEELEEKLQFFFGDDEDVPKPPPEEEAAEEAPAAEAPAPPAAFAPPSGTADEYEDELDVELPVDEGGEVAPALFDSEEEGGFTFTEEKAETPSEELEEKLQFFFGEEEETFAPEAVEEAVAQKQKDEEELAAAALKLKEEEEEELSVVPALAGEQPEEDDFSAEAGDAEAPPEGLEEKLAFFFGEDEAPEPEPVAEAAAGLEEIPEALFEEEEEEFLLTPALSAVDEKDAIEPAAQSFGAISTPEDYTAALEKMRSEFEAREQSLRDEIATLKQEIKSLLQSQL